MSSSAGTCVLILDDSVTRDIATFIFESFWGFGTGLCVGSKCYDFKAKYFAFLLCQKAI